ncbi:Uncharacterised protein [uncultured archaeon]|nr:Uncharacterised protein [uncultured archaeon]
MPALSNSSMSLYLLSYFIPWTFVCASSSIKTMFGFLLMMASTSGSLSSSSLYLIVLGGKDSKFLAISKVSGLL